jgi:hypothetical protein
MNSEEQTTENEESHYGLYSPDHSDVGIVDENAVLQCRANALYDATTKAVCVA